MRLGRAALAVMAACTGCTASRDYTPQIDAVIERCGLHGMVRLDPLGGRLYRVAYVNPATPYEKVDCLLDGARRLRVDLGFVGNERSR